MSVDSLAMLMAMLCVLSLLHGIVQLSLQRPITILLTVLCFTLWIILSSETAAHTSFAQVVKWASEPERRQDIAALMIVESLLLGSQAVAAASDRSPTAWQWAGKIPPPSLFAALYFLQLWLMLSIDGIDYASLSWGFAAVFIGLFVPAVFVAGKLLTSCVSRSCVRLCLYVTQAGIAIWLTRPSQLPMADKVSLKTGPLLVVATLTGLFMALGWVWQRRIFRK